MSSSSFSSYPSIFNFSNLPASSRLRCWTFGPSKSPSLTIVKGGLGTLEGEGTAAFNVQVSTLFSATKFPPSQVPRGWQVTSDNCWNPEEQAYFRFLLSLDFTRTTSKEWRRVSISFMFLLQKNGTLLNPWRGNHSHRKKNPREL